MNRQLIALIMVAAACSAAYPSAPAPADTLTASEAFVRMPAQTLDILTTSQRRDLLDWFKADSVKDVRNAMEGTSRLAPPLSDRYLQVQVTPVTRLTIAVLPARKSPLVMSLYTIGDSLQAADTEIRFYDPSLRELKRDKFIKTVSTDDFFDFDKAVVPGAEKLSGKERKKLIALVPFPTVEYTVAPDCRTMTARITVGEFLGEEVMKRIKPYLRRERTYTWNGSRWQLNKE